MAKSTVKGTKIKLDRSDIIIRTIGYVVVTLYALACVLPFLIIIGTSFTAEEVIRIEGAQLFPKQFTTKAYEMVLQGGAISYAGDIIGLFDPGIFSIGDTLCTGKKHVQFAGIPTFAPEHFARVTQVDTMKLKQFVKGMEQIAQEGAIQIFRDLGSGMEEVIVGVVGVLQLEVLEYRLKNEYNVDIRMQQLPYEHLRWAGKKLLSFWKIRAQSALTVTINLPALSFQIFFIKRDINFLFGLLIPSVMQKKCLSLSLIILRPKTPK